MAGLYQETWTGEVLKKFRPMQNHIMAITNQPNLISNNKTVNLADAGVDPEVLINTTTYPIATAASAETAIAIAVDRYDSENTEVQDEDLKGLPYDKIKLDAEKHAGAIMDKIVKKSTWNLAPVSDAAGTPIVRTTGASNGEVTPRKAITMADIKKAKRKFDDLDIPAAGRILVLCPEHVEQLLGTNESFEKQYSLDNKDGKIGKIYGFAVYEFSQNPVYDVAFAKVAFGATAAATDRPTSVFYFQGRVFRAMETKIKSYMDKAENNPTTRKTVIGGRLWGIVLPKKQHAIGAIVGDDV